MDHPNPLISGHGIQAHIVIVDISTWNEGSGAGEAQACGTTCFKETENVLFPILSGKVRRKLYWKGYSQYL